MVQQVGPILFVAKDKPEQSLIVSKARHMGISSSHFHHVGLIRVRYFDNLICGWTGAWVLFLLEQASHL